MREESFAMALLLWFQDNRRALPWRESAEPYHVWLSEIMLQQTRVQAVLGYYQRFLAELPTIEALANCHEDLLLKLWEGLGYYNRARNLQKGARQIMECHGGEFPQRYEDIRALSGIGDYTAGAIASTVYGLPYPAVDGNVYRVYARLYGDFTDISTPDMKKRVYAWVQEEMPQDFAGVFNQALMELGAMVCRPSGAPSCGDCPVHGYCDSAGTELWRDLPVKPSKKPRKQVSLKVYVLQHQGKIALRKREAQGLLASLWEYPNWETEEDLPSYLQGAKYFGSGRHLFTHVQWDMEGYFLDLEDRSSLPEHWLWVGEEEREGLYSVPSAFSFVKDYLSQHTMIIADEKSNPP